MTGLPGNPGAAASHSAAATTPPTAAPSPETGEDDARARVSLPTHARDPTQRRRAEKTTVRPPAEPPDVENGA